MRPLSLFSQILSGIEREYLVILHGFKVNRSIVFGYPIQIVTDHRPLISILKRKEQPGRIARWQASLLEYDLEAQYLPGRFNKVADALSRIECEDTEAILNVQEENEDELEWDISEIKNAQDAHPLWGPAKKKLLEEQDLGVSIPILSEELEVAKDGLQYRIIGDPFRGPSYRVVIPESRVATALKLAHTLTISGHGSPSVTLARLRRYVFWP